ncbi:MAG: hypothetical protein OXT67_07805 [Zetaproteobacteria bacterium]|nr:hypothetical protein [Zetaproteobacteria bacterium]
MHTKLDQLKSAVFKGKHHLYGLAKKISSPLIQAPATTEILRNSRKVDEIFDTLRQEIFITLGIHSSPSRALHFASSSGFFAEYGYITSGLKYFYVQPKSQKGWLVQRSGFGWTVSQAAKVITQEQFMRASTPEEAAIVHVMHNHRDNTDLSHPYRIASSRDPLEHTSFTVYLKQLEILITANSHLSHE